LARHIDPMMEQVEAAIPTEAEAVAELRALATPIERQELYRRTFRTRQRRSLIQNDISDPPNHRSVRE
jgi:hypothetical protein